MREREINAVRGDKITMIFQEPMTSLDPLYRVGRQLAEPMMHHRGLSKREAREKAIALLDRVGIPDPQRRVDSYPHELSGGQRQRVMIAMEAPLQRPRTPDADEPTIALRPWTRGKAQTSSTPCSADLQREARMAIVFIHPPKSRHRAARVFRRPVYVIDREWWRRGTPRACSGNPAGTNLRGC